MKGKVWLEASAYGRFLNNWTGKDASTTIMDSTERSAQSLVSHEYWLQLFRDPVIQEGVYFESISKGIVLMQIYFKYSSSKIRPQNQ